MRWFKPNLRSSIHAIFSSTPPPSQTVVDQIDIEDIRKAMLMLLDGTPVDGSPNIMRRISYASEVQTLWFLRGDLMAVLANAHGEAVARQMIGEVSDMFGELLPQGLRSRPSPLSDAG